MQKCKTSTDPRYQSLYRRVDTVVFFGTPHRVSEAGAWGQLVRNLVVVAQRDSNPILVRNLEVDCRMLECIHHNFRKILREGRIRIHTFQEGQGLRGVKGFTGKVTQSVIPYCYEANARGT